MKQKVDPKAKPVPLSICHACRSNETVSTMEGRVFSSPSKKAIVFLYKTRCLTCGLRDVSAAQHDTNLLRLAARKPAYGPHFMGEELLVFRLKYGLSSQACARIFGVRLAHWRAMEAEDVFADDELRRLLASAISNPVDLKRLADLAGVLIPLWPERCEDAGLDPASGAVL